MAPFPSPRLESTRLSLAMSSTQELPSAEVSEVPFEQDMMLYEAYSSDESKKVSNARIHSYMCMFSENDKVNLVTQRNYDKKRHKSCVSEFTLASCGSEMVVASFRGREFYDFLCEYGPSMFQLPVS